MSLKLALSALITLFFVVGFPYHGMTEQPAKLIFYLEGINSFLPGLPITYILYVKNPNDFPVYIIHQTGEFWYSFRVVETNSGARINCYEIRIKRIFTKLYRYEEIPSGGVKRLLRYGIDSCDIHSGHRYRLIACIHGVDPEPGKGTEHYWKGEKCIEKEFYVEIPQGIDREVYEKTQGAPLADSDLILNRYPTSTYAGWVLLRKLYGPDPYNMKRWVNPLHPETTPSWAPQFKDDEAHHFLFIIRNVLQNHPEFPFLNHMKYAEIGMLNQLNRRKELIKRLEVYRHDPDPITAQWAQFYYDVFTHGKDK